MSSNGSLRGTQTAEDYYGEGLDTAYMPDMRGHSIPHEVSEFLYNLLEQIVFTSPDEGQERQRIKELSNLYDNYLYLSERVYASSRWPSADDVTRHLKLDNGLEGWQVPVCVLF